MTPERLFQFHHSNAEIDVLQERRRQVNEEGWTPEHDDQHGNRELAQAAAAYLVGIDGPHEDRTADDCGTLSVPVVFPPTWAPEWWKPGSAVENAGYRRRLVKGVALALAEIERVDRLEEEQGDVHKCFICDQPFKAGEMVLPSEDGLGHRECFGDDREGYVKDLDSMEPLGPDDPIPAGEPYKSEDWALPD